MYIITIQNNIDPDDRVRIVNIKLFFPVLVFSFFSYFSLFIASKGTLYGKRNVYL